MMKQFLNNTQVLNRWQYVSYLCAGTICLYVLFILCVLIFGQGFVLFLQQNHELTNALSTFSFIALYVSLALILFAYIAFVAHISVQRLHHLKLSGWWFLLIFLPYINILLLLFLFFKSGKKPPKH